MINKALEKAVKKLKSNKVKVKVTDTDIFFKVNPERVDLGKVRPLLYFVVNKFEQRYFILIQGLPFCFMPGLASHINYRKQKGKKYIKQKQCRNCRYCFICPGIKQEFLVGKKIKVTPVKDLPQELIIELTKECNLNCPLCFKGKAGKSLPLKRVKNLIDESHALGIKSLRFTGGEPLLYDKLGKALVYAKKKGFYVTVNSNGTLFKDKHYQLFKDYVDNVLISFQGFNQLTENKLTGARADFAKKIKTLARLSKYVFVVRVGTVISQTLCANFEKYFYLLKHFNISKWELYRPLSEKEIIEFKISKKDLINLMEKIRVKRKKHIFDVRIFNPLSFCISSDAKLNRFTLFGANQDDGHNRLVYDSKGFRPSYSIDKYLGENIEKAWNNPFLKKIRSLSYLPKKCKKCFYLNFCKGGSRYMAKIKKGSYFASDSFIM